MTIIWFFTIPSWIFLLIFLAIYGVFKEFGGVIRTFFDLMFIIIDMGLILGFWGYFLSLFDKENTERLSDLGYTILFGGLFAFLTYVIIGAFS